MAPRFPKDPFNTGGRWAGGPKPERRRPTPHTKGGPEDPENISSPGGDVSTERGLDQKSELFQPKTGMGGVSRSGLARAAAAARAAASVAQTATEPISGARVLRGFFQNMPWDGVEYFSRTFLELWPDAAGVSTISRFTIPKGMALVLTSIKWRILLPEWPSDRYFARDEWLLNTSYVPTFFIRIGGAIPWDHKIMFKGGLVDGWGVLNQNILIQDVQPAKLAREGQEVHLYGYDMRNADVPDPNPTGFGAELEGFWLSMNDWNTLKGEHNR